MKYLFFREPNPAEMAHSYFTMAKTMDVLYNAGRLGTPPDPAALGLIPGLLPPLPLIHPPPPSPYWPAAPPPQWALAAAAAAHFMPTTPTLGAAPVTPPTPQEDKEEEVVN